MRNSFQRFRKNADGAVTVETSFLILLLTVLTGGAIEASYAFYQWNGAQTAARTGARIAATYDPVARDIRSMTGLESVQTGAAMPAYDRQCSSDTQRCSRGGYDAGAMRAIIFGPDDDNACAATTEGRRGMCDVFPDVRRSNVDVSYTSSGFGRAGFQADPAPIITVRLRDVPLNFAFLDLVGFGGIATLPPVEVTVMGEDLRDG